MSDRKSVNKIDSVTFSGSGVWQWTLACMAAQAALEKRGLRYDPEIGQEEAYLQPDGVSLLVTCVVGADGTRAEALLGSEDWVDDRVKRGGRRKRGN